MNIGFVGVGGMGAAMIPNLVKAGHRVAAWNRDPSAVKKLENVTVLDSPIDAFQNDAVITMLADDPAVRSVLIDSGALASAAKNCVPQHANIAKVAGNMMITFAIQAMGEATALTESYGVKAADFLEIVTNTMFAGPSYKRYGENIAKGSYEPGFKLALGLKDVNLALDAAKAKQTNLPTAEVVRENMEKAIKSGLGDKDWSALAKAARRQAGLAEAVA